VISVAEMPSHTGEPNLGAFQSAIMQDLNLKFVTEFLFGDVDIFFWSKSCDGTGET
jgi:hypothetical protein